MFVSFICHIYCCSPSVTPTSHNAKYLLSSKNGIQHPPSSTRARAHTKKRKERVNTFKCKQLDKHKYF